MSPNIFRPENLAEGKWVIATGNFIPFLHWGLSFVVQLVYITVLILDLE